MIEAARRKLADEVEQLNHELWVTIPEALGRALRNGDLRENGDYQAALERQRFIHARLTHLRARLAKLRAVDVSKLPTDRVGLGSRVVVHDFATKRRETFELVIPDAMDFTEGQISVGSPLGRALLEKRQGETVTVRLPAGVRRLKLVEVVTLHQQLSADQA